MNRAQRVGVALASLMLLAACSSDGPDKQTEPETDFRSYVAMGDSSVAGPDISPADTASGSCARSQDNWPALLGLALNVETIKDVSCSGAVSDDILKARPAATAFQPDAQLDAVTSDTDLVTISIGGNDEGLFTKITLACLAGKYATDAVCASFVDTKADAIIQRTAARVTATLRRIHAKAPEARVVLVGYLRTLPAADDCSMPGLDAARVRPAASAWSSLDDALAGAATKAKVDYVSMAAKSVGHASCDADKAWVNGLTATRGNGAVLHPNAEGMRAVSQAVAARLVG